jgi:DNA-binding GntR family transcriptional regulator
LTGPRTYYIQHITYRNILKSIYGDKATQTINSLSNRAYDAIKEAILTVQLSREIFLLKSGRSVGREPTPERLFASEKEGLVHLIPHKGAYIAGTRRDVGNL